MANAVGVEHACTMQEDKENLRGKLEESKHQLQGNEQMIKWLNNQVGLLCTIFLVLT